MKLKYLYLLLTLLTFLAGYVFLRLAYKATDEFPFTQEIILIVLGTIATIVITAALLNRQTELELRKEQQVLTFELKSQFYVELINFIEKVIAERKLSNRAKLQMKFLTHKISIIANYDVLKEYENFLETFYNIAQDNNISVLESQELSKALSHLCSEIRWDLLGDADLNEADEQKISQQILRNAQSSL